MLALLFQSVPLWLHCLTYTLFFAKFPCFPKEPAIYMLSWKRRILSTAICASIWFICTRRGFVKVFFITFYGMSLWFGIIKYSLYVYQSQIPVDHKDRLSQENSILKGVKSEPSLKMKTQLYEMLIYYYNATKQRPGHVLISIINICLWLCFLSVY